MNDSHRLALVRALHTAIYLVMAGSTFVVLYAGVSGAIGAWLWAPIGLLLVESIVFAASGMKCPLTAVVTRYDASGGEVSDTFFPRRLTQHTLQVFGPLMAIGLALVAVRSWLGV